MTYIGSPSTPFTIPVTKGSDFTFGVFNQDSSGNALNWSTITGFTSIFIAIEIVRGAPEVINASVIDNVATILIPSSLCDLVKNSTPWRLYMVTMNAGIPFTKALSVGGFERDDGGAQ